jgi:predicted nucleic acid-binding protein
MIVLDTNVLSEPFRRRADTNVLAWLTSLETPLQSFAGSVLAHAEVAAASRGGL